MNERQRRETLEQSIDAGEELHEDSIKAKKLFEKLKGTTNFEAVIEQRKKESEDFLEEAKAFARVADEWCGVFIIGLSSFKTTIAHAIKEIKQIPGMTVEMRSNSVVMRYDIKDDLKVFTWQFPKKFKEENGNKWINSGPKTVHTFRELAKEENKVIKYFGDVITLNYHLERYLDYIRGLRDTYHVTETAREVEHCGNHLDDSLINNLHVLTKWWSEVSTILISVKKDILKTVKLDEKTAKLLEKFFKKEEQAEVTTQEFKLSYKDEDE